MNEAEMKDPNFLVTFLSRLATEMPNRLIFRDEMPIIFTARKQM
jgi:hypothetical protein